jgi:hypothetical protein
MTNPIKWFLWWWGKRDVRRWFLAHDFTCTTAMATACGCTARCLRRNGFDHAIFGPGYYEWWPSDERLATRFKITKATPTPTPLITIDMQVDEGVQVHGTRYVTNVTSVAEVYHDDI